MDSLLIRFERNQASNDGNEQQSCPKKLYIDDKEQSRCMFEINQSRRTIIILIGIPASGKTTFYQRYFKGSFEHINLDTLHTRNNEQQIIESCIADGKVCHRLKRPRSWKESQFRSKMNYCFLAVSTLTNCRPGRNVASAFIGRSTRKSVSIPQPGSPRKQNAVVYG